jgi:AraC-like DNA-binding protein
MGENTAELKSFNEHTIVWIKSGFGNYEVDFKKYLFAEEVVLYLEPGQYFRVTAGELKTESFGVDEQSIQISEYRYLFKHLISVGHIKPHFHKAQATDLGTASFLKKSLQEWEQLNPLHATRDELKTLFDLHDQIEKQLRTSPSIGEVVYHINSNPKNIQRAVKQTLNMSIKDLIQNRKLLEAQRELTFSSKAIKEIAYNLGFDDPAYFSRFFTSHKRLTPELFRESINAKKTDTFLTDLLQLIDRHYREQHSTIYYASKIAMSPRNLSRRVSDTLNTSVKDIINKKLLAEASRLLHLSVPITEVAWELGFKEPQHFTNFYKLHTGLVPSLYHE